MALKLKVTAAEYAKLSDAKKEDYIIQADGSYSLDVDDMPDTGALSRALQRERDDAKTSKARVKEIEAELAELQTQAAMKNKDVDALTAQHAKKIGETTAEFTTRIAKRDAFIQTTLIDSVASKIAGKISTAPNLLLPHIKSRMQVNFDGDEPATVILDKDGKPSKMTVDELSAEFVANKDYAAIIRASNASGSAGPAKTAASGGKLLNTENVDVSKMRPADLAARIEASKQQTT